MTDDELKLMILEANKQNKSNIYILLERELFQRTNSKMCYREQLIYEQYFEYYSQSLSNI